MFFGDKIEKRAHENVISAWIHSVCLRLSMRIRFSFNYSLMKNQAFLSQRSLRSALTSQKPC